jgi:hypothetical protein
MPSTKPRPTEQRQRSLAAMDGNGNNRGTSGWQKSTARTVSTGQRSTDRPDKHPRPCPRPHRSARHAPLLTSQRFSLSPSASPPLPFDVFAPPLLSGGGTPPSAEKHRERRAERNYPSPSPKTKTQISVRRGGHLRCRDKETYGSDRQVDIRTAVEWRRGGFRALLAWSGSTCRTNTPFRDFLLVAVGTYGRRKWSLVWTRDLRHSFLFSMDEGRRTVHGREERKEGATRSVYGR